MAVPTTGTKLSDVTAEIAGIQTSLQDCVDDATGTFDGTYYTAPATSLKEFRGYSDNDSLDVSIAINKTNHADACAETSFITRYTDGDGSAISSGDIIYTDSAGTTTLNGGGNYYQFPDSAKTAIITSSGVVGITSTCIPT